MFLHLKIKKYTKQNLSQKSMINRSYRPLIVVSLVTQLCAPITLLEDGGQCHHKAWKQAEVQWFVSQKTGDAIIA